MWGTWFLVTIGGSIGLVLLVGALALSAWSPIFAILAFVVIAVVLAGGAALRRSSQYVEGTESDRGHVQEADVIGSKSPDRGAPARGEGGASGAQTLPPPTRP
jgi:membrane protein implicated in regulation of membrane protease activity